MVDTFYVIAPDAPTAEAWVGGPEVKADNPDSSNEEGEAQLEVEEVTVLPAGSIVNAPEHEHPYWVATKENVLVSGQEFGEQHANT
jgi:hypothetical protein